MELAREATERTSTGVGTGADAIARTEAARGAPLDAETATSILRRCTALAARARIDLLTPSRCEATEELLEVLSLMGVWDPAAVEAPDPTMTVLAAAALQDLAERLHDAQEAPRTTSRVLTARIEAVLGMLERLMQRTTVHASA